MYIFMPDLIPIDFDPFAEAKEIEKIVLTNEPQREIWLACVIGGEDAGLSYNESISLEIKGDLDFPAFKKAVDNLVLRHEALRSTISPNGETLIIYRDLPVELTLQDISGLSEADKKQELGTFLGREIDTLLDLQEGPLFKVYLHKLSANEYYFTIIKHHIIGDGWSTGIILEDLSKMYNAYSKGNDITLSPASQISDYASSQASFKLSPDYKQTEDYWLNLYKGDVPQLSLPTDRSRLAPRSYKGNRIDHPLSNEQANQIKEVGAKAGASLVTTLLAAFEVFLYQQTQQKDIVVGLPSSGQAASGLVDVVGHCVNLLPLKTHIDPSLSFTDYLKKRKKEVLDAYDYQRITFGELIKKLYIPRDASRIALVPVIFNIDMGMDNAVRFDGLDFKLISNPRAYENFELYLNATRSKENIILEWSYGTALFDAKTIEGFNQSYHTILKNIVADPGISIEDLTGVATVQIEANLAEEVYIPADKNLITLFEETVKKYSKKTAASFNDASFTYQQLNEKAGKLAAFLIENGINTGDIVALSIDRSMEMLVCLLAVLKAGAVYLPLDPEYPLDRIEFMLEDSSAKMLLLSEFYKDKYQTTAQQVVIDEIWETINSYTIPSAKKQINGHDLAYILYTSGSTGKPKGVKITHLNLINFLLSMQKTPGIKDTDRLLAITTISFDIAGLELYLPLITGAEVVIADIDTIRDGRLLLSVMEEKNISMMQATPSTWQMVIDSGWQKRYALKVLSGGEALSKELADKLLALSSTLWNMYGPTETTIWSTVKEVLSGDKAITIGRPIDNTPVYIMDEHGKSLPAGMTGELYIGGYGVAEGYLNRPELTAEKFVADLYANTPGQRLYRTGDLGKVLENGDILCLGRIDQQVKIRGHRIELGEIEGLLSAQDGIKQSVVIAQEDVLLSKYLVAYIIPEKFDDEHTGEISKELTQEWRRNLAVSLPNYMVPEEFIGLKSFPLTPNGKIDRKAFPKPERNVNITIAQNSLPGNANEQLVADIFSHLLGVTNLKVTDDFFELGGHSILAVKVMVAIEKKTGRRLPIATLFSNPTIEKLARHLSDDEREKWDALVPIKTTGKKDPIFLIHGAGLNILLFKSISEYFDAEQPVYGIQALGLNHETDIPLTIEGISKRYINEILEVSPNGPYSLAGYSLGGFIAFEIARQLKAMGKDVKFVGIMDTYAGSNYYPDSKLIRAFKKIVRQFYKVPFFAKSFIENPKEIINYQKLIIKRKIIKLRYANAVITNDVLTDYDVEIYKKYDKAITDYVLTPSDIEIMLFRVEKRLYYLDDRVYLGWNNFALKGVKIYSIPGDHKTFLEHPNDEMFANIIQQVLDDKN